MLPNNIFNKSKISFWDIKYLNNLIYFWRLNKKSVYSLIEYVSTLWFSWRKTVRSVFTFLHSFLRCYWKEWKSNGIFLYVVTYRMQNRPIYPGIWSLYTILRRDQYRGSYRSISICNRRTTVFRSEEQPTWKFPFVARANFFFSSISLPRRFIPIRYQTRFRIFFSGY